MTAFPAEHQRCSDYYFGASSKTEIIRFGITLKTSTKINNLQIEQLV